MGFGLEDYPIVSMKHPFASLSLPEVKRRAGEIAPDVVLVLTTLQTPSNINSNDRSLKPKRSHWKDKTFQVPDSLEAINELFCEKKWSDGLPIIPPTEERVKNILETVEKDPDEIIASLPPLWGAASIGKIAVNAVMAGCSPEHMPVIIAAIEAMSDEKFNLHALQTTTNPCAPLMVVNGPIRSKLNINSAAGVFGPGPRANAVLGRAIRLVLINIGGARPGELDKATQGQPGKYSFCIAENEEENPWEPYHVEKGYDRKASTVTMVNATGTLSMLDSASSTAESLLTTLVGGMIPQGTLNLLKGGDPLIILSPEHAQLLAREGLSKNQVKEWLFKKARLSIHAFSREVQEKYLQKRRPHLFEGPYDQITVPITDNPEDIMVFVAGGPGRHSVYVPTFVNGRSVIKEI